MKIIGGQITLDEPRHVKQPGSRGGHITGYTSKGEPIYGERKSTPVARTQVVSKTPELTTEVLGDCYGSAWNECQYGKTASGIGDALKKAGARNHEILLVHGYPTVSAGKNKGKKMGHAWVEVGGDLVVDHERIVPAGLYYSTGRIDPKHASKYTREESMRHAMKLRTYGPFSHKVPDAVFRKSQGLPDLTEKLRKDLDHVDKQYPPYDSEGLETITRHSNKEGKWTPARAALHARIVAKASGRMSPQEKPEFVLMGGGLASGKSTIIAKGVVKLPDKHVEINADEIKVQIPEYAAMVKHKDFRAGSYAHEESSYVSKQVMANALANKFHAVLDGSGNGSFAGLEKKIVAARVAGYKVRAEYVTVDVETAVARNYERGKRTGRLPPETLLRENHAAVSRIFPEAVRRGLFDEARLWDTGEKEPVLVVSTKGAHMIVHNEELWDKFLKKGEVK